VPISANSQSLPAGLIGDSAEQLWSSAAFLNVCILPEESNHDKPDISEDHRHLKIYEENPKSRHSNPIHECATHFRAEPFSSHRLRKVSDGIVGNQG